jgi:DNA invertase Pin-like site-specific DNA recombinase
MTIMGGIAEFERGLIRKRCDEGIQRAKDLGKKFGRKALLDPSQRRRIAEAMPMARPWPSWPPITR